MTDNELIAEFMGLPFMSDPETAPFAHLDGLSRGTTYAAYGNRDRYKLVRDMAYDKSWDWLMPVVEKISKISTGDDDFYYPRTFAMRDADGNFIFRFNRHPLYTAKTLIEVTHAAVVEFIKWYNQNRKQ